MTTTTTIPSPSPTPSSTPAFDHEFAVQIGLARRELLQALALRDESLAQAAVGRVADLEELRVLHGAGGPPVG